MTRKYRVNEDYFKKWSPDMSYILGFWFADGCIYKNYFRLDQHKDDKELLEKISIAMGTDNPINISENMGRLSICSKTMVDDIKTLGGAERKSLLCKVPLIPSQYLRDFVRGNFDGDGSIWYNKTDGCYESEFCSGSKEFIDGLFVLLKKAIPNLHGRTSVTTNNGGYNNSTMYTMKFGKNDTIRLKEFMYSRSCGLFLERKRNLFLKTGKIKIARGCMIPYEEAEKYARLLNIRSREKWFHYCRNSNKPIGIPVNPRDVYKNKGWISWSKWLGKLENSV